MSFRENQIYFKVFFYNFNCNVPNSNKRCSAGGTLIFDCDEMIWAGSTDMFINADKIPWLDVGTASVSTTKTSDTEPSATPERRTERQRTAEEERRSGFLIVFLFDKGCTYQQLKSYIEMDTRDERNPRTCAMYRVAKGKLPEVIFARCSVDTPLTDQFFLIKTGNKRSTNA
jgi:hypothetical protein